MLEKAQGYLGGRKIKYACAGIALCILQACATSNEPLDVRDPADAEMAKKVVESVFSGEFNIIESRRDFLNPTGVKIGFGSSTIRGRAHNDLHAFFKNARNESRLFLASECRFDILELENEKFPQVACRGVSQGLHSVYLRRVHQEVEDVSPMISFGIHPMNYTKGEYVFELFMSGGARYRYKLVRGFGVGSQGGPQ
jgi:hypothetical protein